MRIREWMKSLWKTAPTPTAAVDWDEYLRQAGAEVVATREEYRAGLVGVWASAFGDPVVGQKLWRFHPGGVGECQEYGPFGAADGGPFGFQWRPNVGWEIEVRGGYGPARWTTVRFGFRILQIGSCRPFVALVDRSETNVLSDRFGSWLWNSFWAGPLVRWGPIGSG